MALVASFIILFGLLAGLLGVVGLFRPIAALKMPTRLWAVVVLCIGLATCVAGTTMWSSTPEGIQAAKQRAVESATYAATEAEKQKQSAQAKSDALKDQAATFWQQIKDAQAGCESGAKSAADIVTQLSQGRASVVDAYAIAKNAEHACQESWSRTTSVSLPAGASGDTKKAFADAKQACSTSVLERQMAMEQMAKILDEGMRPSNLTEFRETGRAAQLATLQCLSAVMSASEKVGYTLPEFQKAKDEAKPKRKRHG